MFRQKKFFWEQYNLDVLTEVVFDWNTTLSQELFRSYNVELIAFNWGHPSLVNLNTSECTSVIKKNLLIKYHRPLGGGSLWALGLSVR